MKKLFGNKKDLDSIIQNPFEKDCIENIDIHCGKRILSNEFYFKGYVKFKKEKTSGKQEFEGTDMIDVFN